MANNLQETVTNTEPKMCKTSEKIGHAIGVLGHDSMYTLWSSFMTPFLTDIVQLSPLVFGILSVVGKIFDGVNDVAMGFLADKTKSKYGRFRPWILWGGPLFAICMALSFMMPFKNVILKTCFACVMYIAVDVAFTAVDIPYWSLPAAMTNNTEERSGIIGLTTTVSGVISALIGVIVPLALVFFGGEMHWTSYAKLAVILAVFGTTMYLICFKLVREHVSPDPQQKFSLKLGIKNIFLNQPLLCLQISNIIFLLAKIIRGTFNYYYCSYNYGSIELMAIVSLISTVGIAGGSILTTYLTKYVGKKPLLIILMCGYGVASLIQYFAGYNNVTMFFVVNAVASACIGGGNVCTNAMLADTIEYGEWKTGQRNEGLIQSTRCFVVKCVMAVSGVIVAAVTGLTGFMPLEAVQPQAVLDSFHFMYTLFGAGLMILSLVPIFFYKLTEKRHAEIMAELAARKAAKE